MKKFFNVLVLALVGFSMQGCKESENTGFVEVDPSAVSVSIETPKTLSQALEADENSPLLLAEATAVKGSLVLDSWYTSDELDNSGNRMRMVDCSRSEIFKLENNKLVSTNGQVIMCDETLIFESDKSSGLWEDLQQGLTCQVEYPDGSKFNMPAFAHKGRLYVTNKGLALTDLMKTYKESTGFFFVTEDGSEIHSFKVPSKGL